MLLGDWQEPKNGNFPDPINTTGYDQLPFFDDHMYDEGVLMQRIGQMSEVTAAVIWFLSNDTSYVTGTELTVDVGMAAD